MSNPAASSRISGSKWRRVKTPEHTPTKLYIRMIIPQAHPDKTLYKDDLGRWFSRDTSLNQRHVEASER